MNVQNLSRSIALSLQPLLHGTVIATTAQRQCHRNRHSPCIHCSTARPPHSLLHSTVITTIAQWHSLCTHHSTALSLHSPLHATVIATTDPWQSPPIYRFTAWSPHSPLHGKDPPWLPQLLLLANPIRLLS